MDKRIAILMCTYNGERFIEEQIKSLANQTYKNFKLFISDDGSSDNTIEIIKECAKKYKFINKIYNSNFKSFTKNFQFLISKVPDDYDYYGFCDQDDIWLKEKIQHALKCCENGNDLYCSRTILVNDQKKRIGYSPNFKKKKIFENAIMQSIAGANTMLIKKNLFSKLKEYTNFEIISHDWWAYIIATFFNFKVFYDKQSFILYRQHGQNLIGKNTGLIASLRRFKSAYDGQLNTWTRLHLENLLKIGQKSENYQKILILNNLYKEKKIFNKIKIFYKNKFFRQTLKGQLGLYFLILAGRYL